MVTDVINSLGFILTVVGTMLSIFGIVLAVKSIKKKVPVYHISSNNLISAFSPQYQGLKVSYKNEKTENLTVSKIVFFNQGAEMINRDDIETINHIRILAKDNVKILDATILLANNPSSQFRIYLNKEKNHVLLNFHYLSKNQGATIQVIHTGLSSHDIDIVGDIKDVINIQRISHDREIHPKAQQFLRSGCGAFFIGLMVIVVPVFVMVFGLWSFLSPDTLKASVSPLINSLYGKVFEGILLIIIVLMWILGVYPILRSTGKAAPPGLEFYDYEDVPSEENGKDDERLKSESSKPSSKSSR
jgi:hypothetical protein